MSGSSPTRSWRSFRSRWTSSVLLLLLAAVSAFAQAERTDNALAPATSRDKKVIRRWALPGDPRGLAIGNDGTIYVGLAEPQTVLAIDPATGAVKQRLVLDSAEIASTKELVTMRTNPERTRLFIANGSDESASILSLPTLGILREITMEGEAIRDAVPDPKGRYLYLLGRRVHVYDAEGETELRTLPVEDPMAMATNANGTLLAVVASEDFGNAKASVVVLYDTKNFTEVSREPLQTEKTIESVLFAARDRSLVAFSRDAIFDKQLGVKKGIVNTNHVCLPTGSGPQVATVTTDPQLVYAERRCSASGTFSGSTIAPASLYGVDAYAMAYDKKSNTIVATDRQGYLTIYNVPRTAVVK
ncbi:MAG: hypothetical protein QOJ98_1476 [Acidobacteriota bacterium]|nr:hypothetical protein [Acidobacteriota bacterium]